MKAKLKPPSSAALKKTASTQDGGDSSVTRNQPVASSRETVEHDGDLPRGWTFKTVAELAAREPNSITDGPFGSKLKTEHYTRSGPRVIRLTNIGEGTFVDAQAHISDAHFSTLTKHRVFAGDIVIAALGEKLPRACLIPETVGPAIVKADCIRFRPDDQHSAQFLNYALNWEATQKRTAAIVHGVGRPRLNLSEIKSVLLPVASLREERRIVAEIEKQFTRLDAGVAALRRITANLKRYRAAVLKAACDGLLVPTEAEQAQTEERAHESARALIARTPKPPRPNRWSSRSKDVIRGHSALAVGEPKTILPRGWTWSPLVDIARMESGHTPSRNHPEWWGGDIPWIGIADAKEHNGRTIYETLQHTNADGIANSASRLLPLGTVCISRTASVGYVVVMGREMATSQDFVNWTPSGAVSSDWLRIVFSADREALQRFGKGSVHRTVYFPEWLSMHIAVPPLAEQTRIVAEIERRLSVVDKLEAVVSANLQRATRLRQSILQKAFAGELV